MLKDSLSNRFQGAFLGLALGYKLGQLSRSESNSQPIHSGLKMSVLPKRIPQITPLVTSESKRDQVILLHQLTQSLLQHQGFNPVDYEEQWKSWFQAELRTETLSSTWGEPEQKKFVSVSPQPGSVPQPEFPSEEEVAIFALPMALLFHDNLKPLENFLLKREESSQSWETTSIINEGVLAIASAIAQLFTAKIEPAQLIPQILPKLSHETALAVQLEQVQLLLEQNASLEMVVPHLIQTAKINRKQGKWISSEKISAQWIATALAFYCFLSTPSDYRLTVGRCIQTGYQPEVTSAISGALSGAYQGLIGIPVHWRLILKSQVDPAVTSSLAQNATVGSRDWEKELLQLANQLLAVWSGVYNPITSGDSLCQIDVIATKAASSIIRTKR